MVYIVLAVVFVFFAITLRDNGFASTQNLLNILRQTAMISIMSVAGVFVLSAGQIDLTVGSNTAMSAMLVALVLKSTNNIFLALIVALIFGVAVGVINGLLVTRLGLPAFLATLGMMQVIRGAAMWITNTEAVPISNTVFNTIFGTGFVGPVSVLILWTILFYILGYILFNRTPFGKHTLATGGNQMAAQYSGIKVQRIKMYVFMLSGALSAFAGVLYAGRMQSGRYSFGDGDENVCNRIGCSRWSIYGRWKWFYDWSSCRIYSYGNDQQCFDSCKPLICTAEDGKWFYYHCSSCT